jgi:hypothetical protein
MIATLGAVAILVMTAFGVRALRAYWQSTNHPRRPAGDAHPALSLELDHLARIVPSAHPGAWSVADRGGREIVVTTAAVTALTADELAAVLCHERAHLAGRHHQIVRIANAIAKAVPCRSSRLAAAQCGELVELLADDVAVRRSGRDVVITALLQLSAVAPPGALAAGETALSRRVVRLAAEPSRCQPARLLASVSCGIALVPGFVAGVAGSSLIGLHFCPLA